MYIKLHVRVIDDKMFRRRRSKGRRARVEELDEETNKSAAEVPLLDVASSAAGQPYVQLDNCIFNISLVITP